jgi:hypothetical protein
MKCIKTKKQEEGYSMTVKNKTLVANMQHVKLNQIPPLKGPDSQGLNVSVKQATTIKNSENINGRYGQSSTKRRDRD